MRKEMWSPEEDEKLKKCVIEQGFHSWNEVPMKAGLRRCGKSCRLRWTNYLRPGLQKCKFCSDEIKLVMELQKMYGNRWSKIASFLEGRTDNDVKNLWNSQMRRVLRNKVNSNTEELLFPRKSIMHSISSENPNNFTNKEKIDLSQFTNYHEVSNMPPRIFPFNVDPFDKDMSFLKIDGKAKSCHLEYYTNQLLLPKFNLREIQNSFEVQTKNDTRYQEIDVRYKDNMRESVIDQESTLSKLAKRSFSNDSLNDISKNQFAYKDHQNLNNISTPQIWYPNQDNNISELINPNDITTNNMVNDNDEGISAIVIPDYQLLDNHAQIPSPYMISPNYFVSPIIDPINIGDCKSIQPLEIEDVQWLQDFNVLNTQ